MLKQIIAAVDVNMRTPAGRQGSMTFAPYPIEKTSKSRSTVRYSTVLVLNTVNGFLLYINILPIKP